MHKKLPLVAGLVLFSAFSFAQKPDSLPKFPKDSVSAIKSDTTHKPEKKKAEKPSPIKPYKDVITDSAISTKGLFTIHKVDDKWYFEIPDSIFNRDILVVTRYDKVPGGAGVYAGEIVNQEMVRFVKGPEDNIFLQLKLTIAMADSTNAIYQAVQNSNADPYLASFPIKAYGKDHSVVVEVDDLFLGDNPALSFDSRTRKALSIGGPLRDRSFIQSIHTYPINTEVRTVKTFTSQPAPLMPGQPMQRTRAFDAASDVGIVTIGFNHSFLLLPKTPMQPRLFDP